MVLSAVWADINASLSDVQSMLFGTDVTDKFKAFQCKLFSRIAHQLGWDPREGESHSDTLLRPIALARVGLYGDEEVAAEVAMQIEQSFNFVDMTCSSSFVRLPGHCSLQQVHGWRGNRASRFAHNRVCDC